MKDNKPVVALESTLIAQGLPYPKNIEVALAMEEKVREAGLFRQRSVLSTVYSKLDSQETMLNTLETGKMKS